MVCSKYVPLNTYDGDNTRNYCGQRENSFWIVSFEISVRLMTTIAMID